MNIRYYMLISTMCFLMVNSYAAEINNKCELSKPSDRVTIAMPHSDVVNNEEYSPFDIKRMSRKKLFLFHAAGAYPTGFALDYYLQNAPKSLLAATLSFGCKGFVLTSGDLSRAIASGDIERRYGSTGLFMAIMTGSACGLLAGIGTSAYWRLISTVDTEVESLSTLQTDFLLQDLN
jgi:hypothetical protein